MYFKIKEKTTVRIHWKPENVALFLYHSIAFESGIIQGEISSKLFQRFPVRKPHNLRHLSVHRYHQPTHIDFSTELLLPPDITWWSWHIFPRNPTLPRNIDLLAESGDGSRNWISLSASLRCLRSLAPCAAAFSCRTASLCCIDRDMETGAVDGYILKNILFKYWSNSQRLGSTF